MDKLALFKDMLEWAKRKDSHSVRDFAKRVGMSSGQLAAFSKEDEEYEHLYEKSKSHLLLNALSAASHISDTDRIKCYYEIDYDMRKHLEEEGDAPPPPECEEEFDEWFKKRLVKDKIKYDL